ncbi:MAG: flagellar biosynthesis regulator FlaF [Gammaproteobacteria bacterium]
MNPEQQIQQAQRHIRPSRVMAAEVTQLEDVAAQLMTVQRYWNASNREACLAAALSDSRAVWHGLQSALAANRLALPLEVQQNLLILSVYADSKISACESAPDRDVLGSLIALTRTLAGSLKEWQVAA